MLQTRGVSHKIIITGEPVPACLLAAALGPACAAAVAVGALFVTLGAATSHQMVFLDFVLAFCSVACASQNVQKLILGHHTAAAPQPSPRPQPYCAFLPSYAQKFTKNKAIFFQHHFCKTRGAYRALARVSYRCSVRVTETHSDTAVAHENGGGGGQGGRTNVRDCSPLSYRFLLCASMRESSESIVDRSVSSSPAATAAPLATPTYLISVLFPYYGALLLFIVSSVSAHQTAM